MAEFLDFVLRLIDIITDWPVMLILFVVLFRKSFRDFFAELFNTYLPELIRHLSRLKIGPVEAEFLDVRESIGGHSPQLAHLIEETISLEEIESGEAADVDDQTGLAGIEDGDVEAELVEEETETPVEAEAEELRLARAAMLKTRGA